MEGYAQIGDRMSSHPEFAIFRRFSALNAQNLLYLQAELLDLETRLREIERSNSESDNETRKWYARDWYSLSNASDDDGGNPQQWELFLEIRQKLEQYSMSHPSKCPKPG